MYSILIIISIKGKNTYLNRVMLAFSLLYFLYLRDQTISIQKYNGALDFGMAVVLIGILFGYYFVHYLRLLNKKLPLKGKLVLLTLIVIFLIRGLINLNVSCKNFKKGVDIELEPF